MLSLINIQKEYDLIHEIQNKKNMFESIFQYNHDGIAIIDYDTRFLNFNDAFLEITGFTSEELHTKTCTELTHPEDREKNQLAINAAKATGYIQNIEKRCIVKEREVVVNMSVSKIPDKDELILGIKNITDLKLVEEQAKLVSMGEMLGNIAHQWRQPLSLITTGATSVLFYKDMQTLTDDIIDKEMNTINDQAQYLSKTIDDFRNFLKDDKETIEVSVKEIIEYALIITKATLKNNYIQIETNFNDDITIKVHKNEIVQAFINIINNAKDAIKENIDNEEDRVIIFSTQKQNDSLLLTIQDSGGGIQKPIKDRIFEPYFTTKHQKIGTGIGLSMVNNILRGKYKIDINVSNNHFIFDNKKLYGACFALTFKS